VRPCDALDRPIAFHRVFVTITGDVKAALFLSQANYWRIRAPHGVFYKTQVEWEEETGLTRREQETARARLVALGILEEKRLGVPAKLYFRVNADRLDELILEAQAPPDPRLAESANLSLAEAAKLNATNPPLRIGGNRQANTETTQRPPETTGNPLAPLGGNEVASEEDSLFGDADLGPPDLDAASKVAGRLVLRMRELSGKNLGVTPSATRRVGALLKRASEADLMLMVAYHWALVSGTDDEKWFTTLDLLSDKGCERHMANAKAWDDRGRPRIGGKRLNGKGRDAMYVETPSAPSEEETNRAARIRIEMTRELGRPPTDAEVRARISSDESRNVDTNRQEGAYNA
jgi:hypothetical protein